MNTTKKIKINKKISHVIDFLVLFLSFFSGAGLADINLAPAVPPEVFLNLRSSEKMVPEQPESSDHTKPEAHLVTQDCLS